MLTNFKGPRHDAVIQVIVRLRITGALLLSRILFPLLYTAAASGAVTGSECQSLSRTASSSRARMSVPAVVFETAPLRHYDVIARFPHDRDAFTQGLVFYQGRLYESTGLYGHSSVRMLDLESGNVLKINRLDDTLFGEGLAVLDRALVQLTWRAGRAFVYHPSDLGQSVQFTYTGEGWGSASIDGRLVISDGSSWLRFFDAKDHQQSRRVQVNDAGRPLEGLNELEAVDGLLFANIYPGDCIAQIDPATGNVLGWIDLAGLMPLQERPGSSAVANGIAFDSESGRLFVTGKHWPYIFQIRLNNGEHPVGGQAVSLYDNTRRGPAPVVNRR